MLIILILITIFSLIILGSIVYLNDFSLPKFVLEEFLGGKEKYKILTIDPHPDDETMISGGFISYFSNREDVELKHICLTHGEKGDEILKVTEAELARVRKAELTEALNSLGVENWEIWNYPDGGIKKRKTELKEHLLKKIKHLKPDMILVYEKAGIYGHPDHVTLTKVIYDISKEIKEVKILYKTLCPKALRHLKLPTHMAEEQLVPAKPKFRYPVAGKIWKKYNAAKAHKSQNLTHGTPLIFKMLVCVDEYFTDQY